MTFSGVGTIPRYFLFYNIMEDENKMITTRDFAKWVVLIAGITGLSFIRPMFQSILEYQLGNISFLTLNNLIMVGLLLIAYWYFKTNKLG
jgi:hypothetical protein